tara:strand:- start:2207 stop:2689 length:483 start_codon:yes stop_codon:yes gene_type:complete
MKLSQAKSILQKLDTISFQLPNGELVPNHFHVTEVGKITKHFIDCGGTERKEEVINFQLWNANDYDHRLHPDKLLKIIELSENALKMTNLEIEVEYQTATIGKYELDFDGKNFLLTNKQTDCLAKDKCGFDRYLDSVQKQKVKLSDLNDEPCCSSNGNCC